MSDVKMLAKWESVAREVFYGYRNDAGRGVGESTILRAWLSEGTFASPKVKLFIGWHFFFDGNEFSHSAQVDPIQSEDDVREELTEYVEALAETCVNAIIALEARAT